MSDPVLGLGQAFLTNRVLGVGGWAVNRLRLGEQNGIDVLLQGIAVRRRGSARTACPAQDP